MPRVLMIAYHFPPLAGSSGIQRTLRFVQQLPRHDWQAAVLSTRALAYERSDADLDAEIPRGTVVARAWALDSARHLAVAGRHIGATARPDRWVSWKFDGVRHGLRLIRELRPAVLWSTFPIATAHLIAAALQRRTGLPWIADFRDPMAQADYPPDPKTWASYKDVEEQAMRQARWCVFTTPSAAQIYRDRYPEAASRIVVVENGYDEESFSSLPDDCSALNPGCVTLLHSGIVYPDERDPTPLLAALRLLRERGCAAAATLQLRFRASVHDALLHRLAAEHGVADQVEVLPAIGYRDALAEMSRADGLLIMQAANCNAQIPAKLYEYLRTGRPIVGLTDPAGDTAGALRAAGIDCIAPLDDAAQIATTLAAWLQALAEGRAPRASAAATAAADRRTRSAELARLLDRCVSA